MLRALITTAILTVAAIHFFGVPPDDAAGYSLAVCIGLWFTWPLLRRATGLARRARRRRAPRRTAPYAPAAAPALTQINHHHHYYGTLPGGAVRPDLTLPALPQRGWQQLDHDAIYDIIDDDGAR